MSKPPVALSPNAKFASESSSFTRSADRSLSALLGAVQQGLARRRSVLLLAVMTLLLGAFGVVAQAQVSLAPVWSQQSPTNSPPIRYIDAEAYDSAHGQVVLFGGFGAVGYLNDTWLWNGTNWIQASPATVPPARAALAMAYDPAHGQVVMFGGLSNSGRIGDTWLWDGTNWTQASPANSPPARGNEVMVYDPTTSQLLLFGGVRRGWHLSQRHLGLERNELDPAESDEQPFCARRCQHRLRCGNEPGRPVRWRRRRGLSQRHLGLEWIQLDSTVSREQP